MSVGDLLIVAVLVEDEERTGDANIVGHCDGSDGNGSDGVWWTPLRLLHALT